VNLLPYLDGHRSDLPHAALYWRFGQQIAIRMGDWKLVKAPGGGAPAGESLGKANTDGAELYNLANDIGEKQNLAQKEPAKLKELADAWNKWNAELAEPAWRPARALAAAKNPDAKAARQAKKAAKAKAKQ
jgi:arylsulfatase A-like enzyme